MFDIGSIDEKIYDEVRGLCELCGYERGELYNLPSKRLACMDCVNKAMTKQEQQTELFLNQNLWKTT